MDGVIGFLVLLAIVACVVMLVQNAGGGVDRFRTTRSPGEVIQLAATAIPKGTMSMRSSWMPTGRTDSGIGFQYTRRRSILLALVLLAFFLVPGIIYLVLGGKKQTVQIETFPEEGGTSVHIATSGGVARRRARGFMESLTTAPVATLPAPA